jgi:protein-S-isoprenylcysteine O-methyltransferase Ste14
MVIDGLRLFLLSGLVLHKAVWEVLKRAGQKQSAPGGGNSKAGDPMLALTKAVKIGILLGILAQTVSPVILPLAADPTGLRVAGAALFAAGLALAIVARFQLGRQWSDIEVGSVSRDHSVIDTGVYGLIRHPIYTGDLMLLAGLELALNSWLVLAVAALAAAVFWKSGKEERKLAAELPGYREYQLRTKKFIPFVV